MFLKKGRNTPGLRKLRTEYEIRKIPVMVDVNLVSLGLAQILHLNFKQDLCKTLTYERKYNSTAQKQIASIKIWRYNHAFLWLCPNQGVEKIQNKFQMKDLSAI